MYAEGLGSLLVVGSRRGLQDKQTFDGVPITPPCGALKAALTAERAPTLRKGRDHLSQREGPRPRWERKRGAVGPMSECE